MFLSTASGVTAAAAMTGRKVVFSFSVYNHFFLFHLLWGYNRNMHLLNVIVHLSGTHLILPPFKGLARRT